jgi:hypothetical protein
MITNRQIVQAAAGATASLPSHMLWQLAKNIGIEGEIDGRLPLHKQLTDFFEIIKSYNLLIRWLYELELMSEYDKSISNPS